MGSVLLRRQRLAAELAITSGKSRDFASTTITASRKASKTASVNGRVALLANRTYSGDVAIHWYSGQLKSDHLYALHIHSAYPQGQYEGFPDRCGVMA